MRQDWITGFQEYTENITSPPIFRKWAAICTIAGAIERKGWVHTLGSNLYPNLYVTLIAPPGVGKTEVTWRVNEMWQSLEEHCIASSSVTKASLIDELDDAKRRILDLGGAVPVTNFNSLLICSNELGVLIPTYDMEFMNTLTDLYDCKTYSESRRTKNIKIRIDNPQLNFLAACTPSYLMGVLPEGAWDQGFLSRMILIYSGERQLRGLFDVKATNEVLGDQLKDELAIIGDVHGKFEFTEEAGEFINRWHMSGGEPKPDHPKLHHYSTRRTAHVLKLSMSAAASATDDRIITLTHVETALDWLIEAELYMPDIFKAMTSGGDARVIEDTWHYMYTAYLKKKEPIRENRLVMFLQERTPAHNINNIIEVMERAGFIKKQLGKHGNEYVPRGKAA